MEQVTVLFAIGQTNITEKIAEKYCQYAEILASQVRDNHNSWSINLLFNMTYRRQGQFVQAQHYLSILRNTVLIWSLQLYSILFANFLSFRTIHPILSTIFTIESPELSRFVLLIFDVTEH